MKNIKSFETFNESIRDKMEPKSAEEIKKISKKPIYNKKGECRWLFNWENSGGNSVWAITKRDAKKLSFEMGLPSWMPTNQYAKKTLNDIKEEFGLAGYRYCKSIQPNVDDEEKGWSSGLKVNMDTLRKETLGVKGEHDKALNMLVN